MSRGLTSIDAASRSVEKETNSSIDCENIPAQNSGRPRSEARVEPPRPASLRTILSGSLRSRLVVIVLAIDCIAAALTGSVIIYKGRMATKLEIASSMQLADLLVTDTIRVMKDQWDYDGVKENILVDMPNVDGKPRKTLVHFDRNGFAYVLDRTDGTLLRAPTSS